MSSTALIKVEPLLLSTPSSAIRPVSRGFLDLFHSAPDEKPLIEMINIALNRDTLEQMVTAVEKSKPLKEVRPESAESNTYLTKILREEVQKQFSEKYRPLVELILNGVDARPRDHRGAYVVQVKISDNIFEVSDNGKGMSLSKILDTLIVPFNSDKDALADIGRFGVGFFSDLQYCLQRPGKAKVTVRTGDSKSSYELKVYARGERVEDLQCSLGKIRSTTKGTYVSVSGIPFKEQEISWYLSSYLQFFDPRRAIIVVNGKPINVGKHRSPLYTVYTVPVELNHKGETVTQEVRIGIDLVGRNKTEGDINYYSQGVFVQGQEFKFGRIDIDFPSAVPLVEGRDELKRDRNFYQCFQQIALALVQYAQDHNDDPWSLFCMREAIPLFMDKITRSNISKEDAAKSCFPQKTYLVDDYTCLGLSVNLRDFFGDEMLEKIYIPQTSAGKAYWQEILPSVMELTKDHATAVEDQDEKVLERIKARQPHYVGYELSRKNVRMVSLNNVLARSPVLKLDSVYYINKDHPYITGTGFVADYGLQSYLLRQKDSDQGAEDTMIEVMGR